MIRSQQTLAYLPFSAPYPAIGKSSGIGKTLRVGIRLSVSRYDTGDRHPITLLIVRRYQRRHRELVIIFASAVLVLVGLSARLTDRKIGHVEIGGGGSIQFLCADHSARRHRPRSACRYGDIATDYNQPLENAC